MWVVVGDFGEELAFSAMDGGGEGGEEEEGCGRLLWLGSDLQ